MVDLYRHRTTWAGGVGGAGVTTLYSTSAHQPTDIKAFWTAIAGQFPPGITWTIKGSGDKIDEATGNLTGAWSAGSDLTQSSTATAQIYSAPVGAIVRIQTATIVGTRRLQGRLFLVPLVSGAFDQAGTLATTAITTIGTAFSNLNTAYATHLVVYSRPFAGKAAVGGKPAKPARTGSSGIITGAIVPDFAAVLRSRRS